jgi:orotate phosphoribosyltransferase
LALTTSLFWPTLAEADVAAVGGPTLGADPIVAGLMLESMQHDSRLQGFLVRGTAKDHGTGRQIEGHCPSGARVAVLDDVATRGGSILRAIRAVRAAGADPVLAMALVDREQGGRQAIEDEGVAFHATFQVGEILEEASQRNL